MSKGNTFENDHLKLVFNGGEINNLAINATSAPLTGLYISMHATWPGEGGSQTTGEHTWDGYARVSVARTSAAFPVSGNTVGLAAAQAFVQCTSGSANGHFWGIGTAPSGAGKILYAAPFGSALGVFVGATSDTITIPGLTGVSVNDKIAFFPIPGSTLPTGITEGTVYFVLTVATNDITISTTQGGSTLDITAAGAGYAYKVSPIAVTTGVTPQIPAGVIVQED